MCSNIVALEERIDSIRKKFGDQVPVRDVTKIVGEVMGSFEGDVALIDIHFQDELRELLDFIEKAKIDISQIRPKHLSENKIPEASDQLDEVVNATEEAASSIMDAAEEIGELAAGAKGELAERLEAISTKIFEASSFQDITGQRVSRVVNTLKHLEEKLAELARAIGDTELPEECPVDKVPEEMDHDELLHGPQLSHEANDQDAIDALLASFD
ncbi:protein phosphatase CheZ [Luteithermobacter gelatinilyticus]|uniref:protein phosphatase CheZ n=1 Tax=Luteithermobacter gelatinilyticus TaxID=2582913 RepID=UPI001106484A|nr:protein phosphatase CheZ [Luteithermobacter gelatinilyticus]|tara:strand:- start:10752 stop:11393 length:642 start_codon:yes stop_codon:yes gene_type:complete